MKGIPTPTVSWVETWTVQPGLVEANTRFWVIMVLMLLTAAGLLLRLNGLGDVGIYSDEKYMVLAARGIIDTGLPYLPSGMLYPRALGHQYLIAASTMVFGESEWAFRLPSAIAGTLCIPLAYLLGRQGLKPMFGLAFAASVAFFPHFLEISQIARMYVFLLLAVLCFLIALTYWERTGSWWSVALMIVAGVIGIEFQILAIFLVPLVFVPLLISPSCKRAVQAGIVIAALITAYVGIELFVGQQYAGTLDEELMLENRHPAPVELAGFQALPLELLIGCVLVIGLAMAFFAWRFFRRTRWGGKGGSGNAVFLGLGGLGFMVALLAAAAVSYLPAVLALCMAVAFYLRGGGGVRPAGLVILLMTGIFCVQALVLLMGEQGMSLLEFIKFFIAFPSPTPVIRFIAFFPFAVALFIILCAVDILRVSRGEALPSYLLLVAAGVVAPMLVMGIEVWSVAPRYMIGLVPVFLFSFFLALENHLGRVVVKSGFSQHLLSLGAVLAVALTVPPGAMGNALDRSYGPYPDHKGAAAHIQNLELAPSDIVIVMEAPIHIYYLGQVDYLLRHINSAGWQSRRVDGEIVDIFTGTQVLFNAERFKQVLTRPERGAVYIIGSAEKHNDLDRNLGEAILALFSRYGAEVVFEGRDRKTIIWKLPAGFSVDADGAQNDLSTKPRLSHD